MIDRLLMQMRNQAGIAMSNVAFTRIGTITNYDPINYAVKVILEPVDPLNPNESLTGWLPILSQWVGNNWGMFAPPQIGNSCAVHFSEGNYSAAFVSLVLFNNSFRPLQVESGEFWLVHQSGSSIKLLNDGSIEINSNSVKLGDIAAGNLKKLLNEEAAAVFNTHTHTSNGTAPTQQMTASDMTTHTEAN